jgi:putative DNA primase/helicase
LATVHALPVFPARERPHKYHDRKTGKIRTLNAKSPYTKHGLKEATTDPTQITKWWTEHPDALVAVVCGAQSGILVVDIDTGGDKCGEASFASTGLKVPETVQTRTMSGGRHLLFKYPTGANIKNSASTCFGQDVDVRAEGGYVIFAGSVLPDGRRYEYVEGLSIEEVDIAPLPDEYLKRLLAPVKNTQRKKTTGAKEGARNDTLFHHSVRAVHGGLSDEEVSASAFKLNQAFEPPLDGEEVEATVGSAVSYRKNNRRPYTDLGNAERFREAWQTRVYFVKEHRTWTYFDGQRWVLDDAAAARMAHETVRGIVREAAGGDPDDLQQAIRWQKTSEANARIRSLLDIASQLEGLSISQEAFDTHSHLINFTNGTIDLRGGRFRQARASDLITRMAGCEWEQNATAPRFVQFISEVVGGDENDAHYLKKLAGYILSGDRKEQRLQILIGDGGDGKSTFIETLKRLMGDYQTTLAATSISAQTTAAIPNDIAKLAGKRLATISELPQKLHVNTQLVKAMSGGDTMTARFLHKEFFDFQPTAQLVVATNFYPYADVEDKAYFRRLAILRFPKSFAEAKPDKDLKAKLASELRGIAVWAVAGYRAYLEDGLELTCSMHSELEKYRQFTDPLTGFFENCLTVTRHEADFVPTDDIVDAATEYCRSEDRPNADKATVIRYMQRRGLERVQRRYRQKRLRGFAGLRIAKYEEQDVPF